MTRQGMEAEESAFAMSDRRDWGTEAKRVRIRLLEGERPKLVSPNKEEHNLVEVIISVDKVIKERRHETKHAGTLQAKVAVQKTSKAAEARRSKKRQELYNAQDAIDARRDEFIEGIERQLEQGYKLDTLFTVRWSVDSAQGGDRMAEKMALSSKAILAERIACLREVFPEAFTEGKIDFDALKEVLGEEVATDRERYGLSWAGKSEAIRNVQTPSVGTLVPDREESVNFDTTENLFLEGDNLEVLKLLQKSYHGRVKMIYIDPPYNTGNEFIYPDNFREDLEDYLRYSGQVSGDGFKLSTSTETSGRYHSKWLNMMYPRLFLARNLLRDDGVIFVSIDDHEVHNLRLLMNEVFGAENFVGRFVWQSKKGGGSDNTSVVDQEYVVSFAKTSTLNALSRLTLEAEALDKVDDKGPYRRGRELNRWGANSRREDRPTMYFPIPGPNGEEVYPIRNDGVQGCWRWGKKKMFDVVERGDVEFVKRSNGTHIVYEKIRSTDPRSKPYRTWLTDVGTTADGSKTVKELFDGRKVYDFPKPVRLLSHLISVGTIGGDEEIVLDFFAGSCTTAHAVMHLNRNDGGDRSFICVQLPESTPEDSEARKAGYETLVEVGKERIRRVIKELNEEDQSQLKTEVEPPQDRGFKDFKLTSSNFKIWDSTKDTPGTEDKLAEQLRAFANNVKADRSREEILYEILLKAGFPLIAPIDTIDIAGEQVCAAESAALLICLAESVNEELLRGMAELEPARVVCLDTAFHGNDQLKTNAVLEMKNRGIEFWTV